MGEVENVALVGSPNSGKTTLFNWLTGRNQKVVNYPGSTVDLTMGDLTFPVDGYNGKSLRIYDTPGAYSLFAKSQDEEVTLKALYDKELNISKVIAVMDATQISRQVHIIRQLQEAGFEVVVALTMSDLHEKEKRQIDIAKLSHALKTQVVPIDGVLGGGVKDLAREVLKLSDQPITKSELTPWSTDKLRQVFIEGENVEKVVAPKRLNVFDKTKALDNIFLHPVLGTLIFVAVMMTLFSSIYWAAAPLMELVDYFFSRAIEVAQGFLGTSLFSSFVGDGLIGGLGSVFVFVPQIFVLFIGISLLEDTGYLARAAALVDKPLSKVGLNGKAFVPLLSGFACAVPAIMAARSINSKRERWLATFIIPLMTCSARLPVYALLIGFVFAQNPFYAGAVLTALYLGGIIMGAIASGVLNKLIKKDAGSFFLLELPLFRRPNFIVVLRNSLRRTRAYIYKTGPIILVLSMAIWGLSTFPNYSYENPSERLESSYLSQVGAVAEPMFEPMGVDWRVGVGLLAAFAAREVFVSTMAVLFHVSEADDEASMQSGLLDKMREAKKRDGSPVFTTASVAALLVFFMIAMQCLSTLAIAKSEMASYKFALAQFVVFSVVAYALAILTYSVIS